MVATPKTMERDDVDEDDFSMDGSGEVAPSVKVGNDILRHASVMVAFQALCNALFCVSPVRLTRR